MTIKRKMLVSMIVITLVCALAVFVTSIILFIGNINETAYQRLNVSMGLVQREIEQMKENAYRAALQIAGDAELAEAVARGDRDEVVRTSIRLKNLTGVETCAITDSNAIIMARAHQPELYGDSIANQFNIQSALSGNPVATIEIGTVVRFSVRGGAPIYDAGGALVGAVTVGFRLDTLDIVDMLGELTGCEVTFFLNDERVATTILQDDGERAVGIVADERISRIVLGGQPYKGRANILGRSAYVYYIPLRDAGGNILGMLFVGEYTAEDTANIVMFSVSAAIAVLIVIVLGIIVSAFISGTIEKQLRSIIDRIQNAARNMDNCTNTLSEISVNLSDGSSEQAASVEQTSATMNETSSMIAQNAENTRQAAQLAEQSKQSADTAKMKMQEMIQAMEQLKDSSGVISKIIKTIDDIAFQTNLLAINATVEAARAGGDAGRSFGVVAEEVRNLAQRSAKAAAETAEVIENNIELTNAGGDISSKVAEALIVITEQCESLDQIIREINAASEEQANGARNINAALTQLEKQTQQNAAMAQETTASSQVLKGEAYSLEQVVAEACTMIVKSAELKDLS